MHWSTSITIRKTDLSADWNIDSTFDRLLSFIHIAPLAIYGIISARYTHKKKRADPLLVQRGIYWHNLYFNMCGIYRNMKTEPNQAPEPTRGTGASQFLQSRWPRVAQLYRSAKSMKLYTMIASWGDDAIVLQTEAWDENEPLVYLIGNLPVMEEAEISEEDFAMLSQFARREKKTKLTPCSVQSAWAWLDGLKLACPLSAYIVETSR
jgi:hypothetical protein